MFDLKRFRGVIFHGDAKFEEKLTCGLEHDKEYRKFSPEQFKVSKLGWWDPLIQSRKSMSLKSTEELCVIKMKDNAKFKE